MKNKRPKRREKLRFWDLDWDSTYDDRHGEMGHAASHLVNSMVKVYDEHGGGFVGVHHDDVSCETGYTIRATKTQARRVRDRLAKTVTYPVYLYRSVDQDHHLQPGGRKARLLQIAQWTRDDEAMDALDRGLAGEVETVAWDPFAEDDEQ